MNTESLFHNVGHDLLLECCEICGRKHNNENCDYIKIATHVPDNPIPPKAKLTLPHFLKVHILSDNTYTTVTCSTISKGTRFGPFQAEKTQTLDSSISFPLKILHDNKNLERYLESNNEEKCSWLMYVGVAEHLEEQNLICYQEKGEIYYVAIKDINIGEALRVWYSPYYAFKMNKSMLLPKPGVEDACPDADVNSLIKKQQKIMERKIWTCKFCSQIESSIVSFARHILKHYRAQHRNMCEICKKTFGSKKILRNHMKIVHNMHFSTSTPKVSKNTIVVPKNHSKDMALGGPLLNDMFTDSSDLQQSDLNQFDLSIDNHNLLLDNDSLTVENLLNENVKDLDHFNFEIDDNQKQFVCDICLKQFNKVKLLIMHLRHHTGDFMCYKCLKIFCRKENFTSHNCNLAVNFKCTLCEKTFSQRKYLSRHLQAVHEKKFHCITCDRNYHSNKELLEHNCSRISDIDKEKFICPTCDKHFYRDIYLKRHLKLHESKATTTRPPNTTCEVCGLLLAHKNSYNIHKKKHGEQPYSCQICEKKFYRRDIFSEHVLTHQNTEQVECHICQKKVKNKKTLNTHLKNHSVQNTVQCTICNQTFKSRPNLNKHMLKVHSSNKAQKKKYYKCPVCDKVIVLKSSVLRHLKKSHADVKTIDYQSIKPKISPDECKLNDKSVTLESNDNNKTKQNGDIDYIAASNLQSDLDAQINNLLRSAENDLTIQKHAVDSLVQELDINKKEQRTEPREVCLSIPEFTDNYEEITLGENAYILENGTIVQPQEDSQNVVIYVLDQTY